MTENQGQVVTDMMTICWAVEKAHKELLSVKYISDKVCTENEKRNMDEVREKLISLIEEWKIERSRWT